VFFYVYVDVAKDILGDFSPCAEMLPNKNKISKMYKSLSRFNIKDHIKKYEKVFNEI